MMVWLAPVLALTAGAGLAWGIAARKRVVGLHDRWVHVDELTGEWIDPQDETGGYMDVPLGDRTVKLRYLGSLHRAWDLLDEDRRNALTRAQHVGVGGGLVLAVAAAGLAAAAGAGGGRVFLVSGAALLIGYVSGTVAGHSRLTDGERA